jgi:hypothetical protein
VVDPYDWLGLPKAQRPPTHYHLLGLDPAVTDAAAIRAAADRRTRSLLPHLSGPDALEAERLWNEVEDARDTLLDPDRRAHYDATVPVDPPSQGESDASGGGARSAARPPTDPPGLPAAFAYASGSAAPDAPLSPDELAAASLPDPNPWWKSTPEAPTKPEPWWKESAPDAPAPPPPAPAVAVAPAPNTTAALPRPTARTQTSSRKRSPVAAIIVGILIAGGVGAGVYFGVLRKHSATTLPKNEQVVEGLKHDPKLKQPEPGPAKTEDPVPETPLPKNFADQLRAKTFAGHAGAVDALAVAGSGSRFVSVGNDKTLRLWSVKGDSITRHTFGSPAVGVAWCAQDHRIAAADGFSLALLDPAASGALRKFDSPRSGVTCMAITGDGSRAITGLTDGFVRLWNTGTGQSDEWGVAARGGIAAVDNSAEGSHALVATTDGPVSVWNLASRNRVAEWTPHSGGTLAVRFSPDGTKAATTGADGFAAIFDIATQKVIVRLEGHAGPVTGIAWLSDGRQVVTVGTDGTARMWAAENGQPLRWSQTLDGKGSSVAIDPGGRFVLVGTSTGTIHLFPLPRVKAEAFLGQIAKLPANPLPVPDADAVTTAIAEVHKELARDFSYSRPDDMALLADNLRRRALVERVSASLRFGLLSEARNLATKAGDVITAFQAIDNLSAWFDIDELTEKATTIAAMPPEVDSPPLISVGLTTAERAELDGRPEVVARLLKRLPDTIPAGTPADRSVRLTALRQRTTAAAAEWKAVRQALDLLKNAPDDQASNHMVGIYLCFAHQDWAAGLPYVAKGTDPRLIDAAKTDLSSPTDPKAQHSLGEVWFRLGLDQKEHRAKRAILGRARVWFERELKAKLDAVDAVKARARLDDIARLDVPSKDPATLPLFAPFHMRRAYNTLGPDVRGNEWRLTGGVDGHGDGVVMPAGSPVLTSRFGLGPGGRLTMMIRSDGREVRINCAGQEFAFAGSGKSVYIAIERAEGTVTVTATPDDNEPVTRTAELPVNSRGPLTVTVRMNGAPARPGGATIASAIVRGPVSMPLPAVE